MYILSSPASRACTNCGNCVTKCTKNAIVSGNNGKYYINSNCDDCGDCKGVCTRASIVNNKIACWQDIIELGATYPAIVTSQSLQQYCPTKSELVANSDAVIANAETYESNQLIMLGDLSKVPGLFMDVDVRASTNGNSWIRLYYLTDYGKGASSSGAYIEGDPNKYDYLMANEATITDFYITAQCRYIAKNASSVTVLSKTVKITSSSLQTNSNRIWSSYSDSFFAVNNLAYYLKVHFAQITDMYGNKITNSNELPVFTDTQRNIIYKFKKLLLGYWLWGQAAEACSIQYITTYCQPKSGVYGNVGIMSLYSVDVDSSIPDNVQGTSSFIVSSSAQNYAAGSVQQKSSTLYPRLLLQNVSEANSQARTWNLCVATTATYNGLLKVYASLTRLTTASAIEQFIQDKEPLAIFDYSKMSTYNTYQYNDNMPLSYGVKVYTYKLLNALNEQNAYENPTTIPKIQLLLVYC